MTTFLLTIFRDLTEAIVVGFALGSVLFIVRMAEATGVEASTPLVPQDKADDANGQRLPYDSSMAVDPDVIVYRITGAFFFGAASTVGGVLDSISDRHKVLIIDFSTVPFLDSTAANTIAGLSRKTNQKGVKLMISGVSPLTRRILMMHGARPPLVAYKRSIDDALASARRFVAARASAD